MERGCASTATVKLQLWGIILGIMARGAGGMMALNQHHHAFRPGARAANGRLSAMRWASV